MDRAGLVGEDGPTHHGALDAAILRTIPNMAVLAPRHEGELRQMLAAALRADGPVAIRYPRGAGEGVPLQGPPRALPWGKAEVVLAQGDDLCILAVGPLVAAAEEAAHALGQDGVECTVINARFIKPLDEALLTDTIRRCAAVLTVEESSLAGGFGSAVLELCEEQGLRCPPIRRLGIPDRFIEQATVKRQRSLCGLDAPGIIKAARDLTQRRDLTLVKAGPKR